MMEKLKLIEAVSELKNLGAISGDSALSIIGLLVSLPEDYKAYVKNEEKSRTQPEYQPQLEAKPSTIHYKKWSKLRGSYIPATEKVKNIARAKEVYIRGLTMRKSLLRSGLKDNSVNRRLLSEALGGQLRPMGTGLHSLRGKHSKRISIIIPIPKLRGGANDKSRIRMKFIQGRVKSLTKAYGYSYETAFRQASDEWNNKPKDLSGIKLNPPVILSEPSQNKALISALGQAVYSGKDFTYGDYQFINPDSDLEEWSRISTLILFNNRNIHEFLGMEGQFKVVREGQNDIINHEK